jgi:hypothetical protein
MQLRSEFENHPTRGLGPQRKTSCEREPTGRLFMAMKRPGERWSAAGPFTVARVAGAVV